MKLPDLNWARGGFRLWLAISIGWWLFVVYATADQMARAGMFNAGPLDATGLKPAAPVSWGPLAAAALAPFVVLLGVTAAVRIGGWVAAGFRRPS